jgi:hypothetical protein
VISSAVGQYPKQSKGKMWMKTEEWKAPLGVPRPAIVT